MTPEELAVIQAAMETVRSNEHWSVSDLKDAVQRLIFSCQECNLGGHTCPGDGNPIMHGATDCGDHDETALSWVRCTCGQGDKPADHHDAIGCPIGVANYEQGKAEPLLWVPRTWRDVRPGDRVRLPSTEYVAGIYTATLLEFHTDPRTGTSSFNPPKPLEHAVMRVRFTDESFPRDMDPGKPVEIELTASEVAALDAAGWGNRVELKRAEEAS